MAILSDSCLKDRNRYTKETIQHTFNRMIQKEVRYISFKDNNTHGLSGAKNGQSHSKSDTWSIYTYSKGFHSEEENEEVETSRDGSHKEGPLRIIMMTVINPLKINKLKFMKQKIDPKSFIFLCDTTEVFGEGF